LIPTAEEINRTYIKAQSLWRTERQENGRMHYFIHATVTVQDEPALEPPQKVKDKALLDIWRKRKIQELYRMELAFDLVKFEDNATASSLERAPTPEVLIRPIR
jgi:hypothetical protein